MTLFLSFPGCSHPGLVGFLPLSGVTAPVWSPGRLWLLRAGSRLASPLRSLAPSLVRADDSLHLVSSLSAEHFGLWPYGLAIAALPLVSRPWTCLCWSHLLSLSFGGSVRWLRGVSPCFAYCPTSSVLKQSSFGFAASSFTLSLRDGVTLPGRVCLSPRSERRLFLHLSGVWFESSRWGHPVGSGFVPDLDRNEDFGAPSLVVGVLPLRWGHPFRVGWRVSAPSIGTKASSIHLSLVASRWGHCGSSVGFPTLDRNEAGFG